MLSLEKLLSLLAEGHESESLDYKEMLDLNQRRGVVDICKDIAAMQSPMGGYIVAGANDQGKVTTSVPDAAVKLFDEAAVRAKVRKYFRDEIDLRVALHDVEGFRLALIYIGPHPDGICVIAADGAYPNEKGGQTTVFQSGDVFVRHGSASERWTANDVARLLDRAVATRKEAWRAEFRNELLTLTTNGLNAQRLEQFPAEAITWQLDRGTFDSVVTELMRRNDDIPLRKLLLQVPDDAKRHIARTDDLAVLLDRMASLAAMGLAFGRSQWFARTVDALVKVYNLGFDSDGRESTDPVDAARLWLSVLDRVYALGGLAVREGDWKAVRILVDRRGSGQDFQYWTGWLRHGLTMAARARLMETEAQSGLLARAHNVIREVPALRLGAADDAPEILDSLCQFDALAGLIMIGKDGRVDSRNFYPNFARYFTRRTEPAFELLIKHPDVRATLFDGDDELLATALRELNNTANRESFRLNGWDGLESMVVRGFIEKNAPHLPTG